MRFAPLPVAFPRRLLAGFAVLVLLAAVAAARAATLEIDGPVGTAVSVDGAPVGRLPLETPVPLAPGLHVVTCALRGYELFNADVLIAHENSTHRLYARLIPLRRRDAVLFSFVFAGLGQRHVGRPTLGWALTGIEAGGLLTGLAGELSLRNRRDDYAVIYDAYLNAITDQEITARRAETETAWSRVEDAESVRRTGLLVAAGAVAVSVLDAWLRFPSFEAGAGPLPAETAAPASATEAVAATAPPMAGATLHVGWTARF